MIKITKRPAPPPKPFDMEVIRSAEKDYQHINLADYLEASTVTQVYIRQEVVQAIFTWVESSLDQQPVPETGGFLLGWVHPEEDEVYKLAIEHFFPAEEIENSTYDRLHFGHEVLYQLDTFVQNSPWSLIGWFHTHPGHTPYLSAFDLHNIHHPHFYKPYQIAMVLDSLTEAYDTGIFSWKTGSNSMNNKPDYPKWISWKSLQRSKSEV